MLAQQYRLDIQRPKISALIHSFINPYAAYRKEYRAFDTIERPCQVYNRKITEKTKYLGEKAKKLLCPIIRKLLKGETVLLNNKYISKVTGRKTRQNKNILNELRGILIIQYHKSMKYYSFKFIPAIVYELRDKRKIVSCNKLHDTCKDSIYIKNKDIEDIDLESNFLQNSEEIKTQKNITPEIILFQKEKVKPAKQKKCLSNARKKCTNAERKARVYHFNQYKEPQDLKHHYPLTKEDGGKLQSLSGRDFSLNAMNEILLAMSKRLDHRFYSKAQFLAYFGKCLRFEKRDAVKTGNDNFRIKANILEEEAPKKAKIIWETELKAYDLEDRTTEGFQRLSVFNIVDKLQFTG
ncbi:MAG: hypothetical protein LBE72_06205 [Rickettsia sp.]|jgi:hypothetical protein|nr:hypothetical protein [Rickettsia sp.]